MILQYLSLPLLVLAMPIAVSRSKSGHSRAALFFCAAFCLVPLLQLIPMPAGLRAHLPGGSKIADSYALFDLPPPAWPISLAPQATWMALLSLIPPLAAFAGMLVIDRVQRRRVCLLIVAVGAFSVFLGLLQLAQGPKSSLRFFEFTNVDDAVGFFANRNHYAALLYVTMLFSGCWAVDALVGHSAIGGVKNISSPGVIKIAGTLTLLAIAVMAQAMTRSRAGVILSVAALGGIFAIALSDRRARISSISVPKLIGGAVVLAIVISLQYTFYRVLERFETDPLADARVQFSRTTLDGAKSFLPFGSGVGSFVYVYPGIEKPTDVAPYFANHAHNDIAEAVLEAGIPALILMALFVVWIVRKSFQVWRERADAEHELDLALKRASILALVLLALHSFVDYPLHTTAMATVAAICCGLLMPAAHSVHHRVGGAIPGQKPSAPRTPPTQSQHHPRREQSPQPRAAQPQPPPSQQTVRRPYERWQGPGEWPAEWSSAQPAQNQDQSANAPGSGTTAKPDKKG